LPAPRVETPAQRRLVEELLGWGGARPAVDDALAAQLVDAIEQGIAPVAAAAEARGRPVLVTKSRLEWLACDGLALDPEPFVYTRASVRGILAHAVIERDWERQRVDASDALVHAVWNETASRAPGDPTSLSTWMNALPAEPAAALRVELVDLLESFREVWPPLDGDAVQIAVEPGYARSFMDGRVRLYGRPDLVLSSPVDDDRARVLVVDLKTGRPRPEHDRQELRFYALLATLVSGTPPFRWATYYVTEGRYESEDLRVATLDAAARRVVDAIVQQVRITGRDHRATDPDLRIVGGSWCRGCRRREACPAAVRPEGTAPIGVTGD
jgi:hypothetical protein